jgi:putative nucleotidyltransferase with HDIG domain
MNLNTFVPELKRRVEHYVSKYASPDPNIQAALDLKLAHTLRVRQASLDIGKSEGLSGDDLYVAEAAALLHDIGRFEQFRRYQTFADARSENHADLGVQVIDENGFLKPIDGETARVILRAVQCHNKASLPVGENGRGLFFMKLLRDADKVDIWHVVTEYYGQMHGKRNQTLELNLPDTPEVSNAVCESLLKGNMVRMKDLKTLNDFKLLQMGWVYDVNFRRTFQIVKEREYLEKIRRVLPKNEGRITEVYELAENYVHEKLKIMEK